MSTCRTCYSCRPELGLNFESFGYGLCTQARRKVMSDMTACTLYQERGKIVSVKSNDKKRNTYRDKDGNKMMGMTLPEVLEKPITILAKREYAWGLYEGLAVKVMGDNGNLGIVEITAETPIKALNDSKLPKMPFNAKFVEKTSKNKRKYYTVELIDDG